MGSERPLNFTEAAIPSHVSWRYSSTGIVRQTVGYLLAEKDYCALAGSYVCQCERKF